LPQGNFYELLLWLILLTIFAYASREIDIFRTIKEIEAYVEGFRRATQKAIETTLKEFRNVAKETESRRVSRIEERVREMVDSVFLEPEDKDPYGLMDKLKHLMLVEDSALINEIKSLVPRAPKVAVENLKDLIEATRQLNLIYKYVEHYYRLGKKFKSIWLLLQLHSLLPFLVEEVSALESSLEAFSKGLPIGDSVGCLVAARFIQLYGKGEIREVVEDTILSKAEFKGREVLVIKAKGPSGVTGRLDDALAMVVKSRREPKVIITVDAALKLEGERSGSIAEGIGVAIGGLGVEKFNIERLATKLKIPLYAILIKMAGPEALSIMSKEIALSIDKALRRVERVIEERSEVGDTVVLVGVGNTIGVYP